MGLIVQQCHPAGNMPALWGSAFHRCDLLEGRLGAGRPVQPESARAVVLGSLASIDLILVFGEDTPLRLIQAIRPDVLVKGAEYRIDQVVGADLVQGYGGRVLLAEIPIWNMDEY